MLHVHAHPHSSPCMPDDLASLRVRAGVTLRVRVSVRVRVNVLCALLPYFCHTLWSVEMRVGGRIRLRVSVRVWPRARWRVRVEM